MKSLILYFSRADDNYAVGYISKGNTEIVAQYIQEMTGADLFKVEREVPYSKEYETCVREAKEELQQHKRPALKKMLKDISSYEIIYIGSPVYFDLLPMPMVAQLEVLDFSDKIIMPFVTHEGSGLGNVVKQLKQVCKNAHIMEGLAIPGSAAKQSKRVVESWIKRSGVNENRFNK